MAKLRPWASPSTAWCQRWASGPFRIHCSHPVRASTFEWIHSPQTAPIMPLTRGTSGEAPSSTMGANSTVWLTRISRAWERVLLSQSTSWLEWCASWRRHSHREPCCQRWNQ